MVQAYHAVPVSVEYEDADGDNGRPAEHEGSALLGSRASSVGLERSEVQKEGHATLSSSVVNLSNTIIGSGAYALHHSPFFCVVVLYSLQFMVMVSRHAHLSSGMFIPSVSILGVGYRPCMR